MSRGVFMRKLHFPSSANAGGKAMFCPPKSRRQNLFATLLLFVLAVIASSILLTAQQSAPPPDQANQGYPITVEGHEVLIVYERLGPFNAQERAQRVSERLTKLVYTPGADVAAITTAESDYGTEIRLGDNVLTIVTDDDAKQA